MADEKVYVAFGDRNVVATTNDKEVPMSDEKVVDLKTPGERLRWARETRTAYTSASDAARAFGWTISTYLGHENGDRSPGRESAKQYGNAYGVPWHWILEGGDFSNVPSNGGREMAIGDRVRLKRTERKLTQKALAEAVTALGAPLSQQNVNSIESGAVERPGALPELARALGVAVEWLIDGHDRDSAPERDISLLLAVRAMIEAGASKRVLLAFIDEALG